MMTINCILFVFLLFSDAHCIQFFVKKNNIACTLKYADKDTDQVANRVCVTIGNNTFVNHNYQITQNLLYGFIDSNSVSTLKGSPFNFSSETINTFGTQYNHGNVRDFTVDWIHNKVYIVMEVVMSGSMLNTTDQIPLSEVLTTEEGAKITNAAGLAVSFQAVRLDPYRRFLFFLVHGTSNSDGQFCSIVRSNLSGQDLKKIMSKPASDEYSRFVVDVNDIRLFVAIKEVLYIYTYEGELLREVRLPYSVTDFDVFDGNVYLTTPQASGIITVSLNQTNNPLSVSKVYQNDLRGDLRIALLDTRLNRQKMEGEFLCDRTDCPELCEVDSSGDNCVCFKTKAKTMDGVRCYDCGQSNLTSLLQQPTIVNGQISYPGDFPWHAVLYNTTHGDFVCGGTLISSQVVLTAAHCVTTSCFACTPPVVGADELRVALGKTNRSWNVTEPYETRRGIRRIVVRDTYLGPSTNFANDIALLFLDSKVSVNSHVMPACLDYNLNQLPYHEELTGYVCGFGYTKECGRTCSNFGDTLLHTTGTIVSTSDCFVALNTRDQSAFHSLTSDKFCVGNGTVSLVQSGDSGGGFTLAYRGLHYVTGVVSVKLLRYRGRTLKYSFGGFTNVSSHMDWIKTNLVNEK